MTDTPVPMNSTIARVTERIRTRSAASRADYMARIREVLSLPDDVRLIPFSAEKGDGRDELLAVILHAAEQ